MKALAYITMVAACLSSIPAHAFSGFNGISFEMSQADVEKLGFVCNEHFDEDFKAVCEHMDMTGVAFGYPVKDFRIDIGNTNKVDGIHADFSGRVSLDDYLNLHSKILHFFPTKNEEASFHRQGLASRDQWQDKTNATAVLLLLNTSSSGEELSITFWSPRRRAK